MNARERHEAAAEAHQTAADAHRNAAEAHEAEAADPMRATRHATAKTEAARIATQIATGIDPDPDREAGAGDDEATQYARYAGAAAGDAEAGRDADGYAAATPDDADPDARIEDHETAAGHHEDAAKAHRRAAGGI